MFYDYMLILLQQNLWFICIYVVCVYIYILYIYYIYINIYYIYILYIYIYYIYIYINILYIIYTSCWKFKVRLFLWKKKNVARTVKNKINKSLNHRLEKAYPTRKYQMTRCFLLRFFYLRLLSFKVWRLVEGRAYFLF